MPDGAPRDRWITLIALGKLAKATALIVVAVVAWVLRDPSHEGRAGAWMHELSLAPGHRVAHRALASVSGVDPRTLAHVGIGALLYAALFVVEGAGLLARKRWAEYLTVAITGSFVPFEVYELARHATVIRALTLVANVAAVAYLVWHLRHARSRAHQGPTPR